MNTAQKRVEPDYAAMRINMIEGQLRPNGIKTESILSAMETLPRERFVPPTVASVCCIDEELPVSGARYLLRPLVLARLIQAAAITSQDRVLDIGAATGYTASILSGMAQEVVALESDPKLAERAVANFAALNTSNVYIAEGDLRNGLKDKGPYNVILIEGGVEAVPTALFDQLAEGGRLVTVVRHYGTANASYTGELTVFEKNRGVVSTVVVSDASASLLAEFVKPRVFTF